MELSHFTYFSELLDSADIFRAQFFFARGLGIYDRISGKSGYTVFGRRLRYSSHFNVAPDGTKVLQGGRSTLFFVHLQR